MSVELDEKLTRICDWLSGLAEKARSGQLATMPYVDNGMLANDCDGAREVLESLVSRPASAIPNQRKELPGDTTA